QAEDGIRDRNVTGVQTCALPILGLKCTLVLCHDEPKEPAGNLLLDGLFGADLRLVGDVSWIELAHLTAEVVHELQRAGERVYRRSEERRVGKEGEASRTIAEVIQ